MTNAKHTSPSKIVLGFFGLYVCLSVFIIWCTTFMAKASTVKVPSLLSAEIKLLEREEVSSSLSYRV